MSKCIFEYLDVPNECPVGKCYIYVLIDPRNDEIRYVGKTIGKISVRYNSHCCVGGVRSKLNYKSINWIKSLKKNGLKPKIQIIDVVNISEWIRWEVYYIDYFNKDQSKLTNTFPGGEPGNVFSSKWSEKTRENQKQSILNRNFNINLIDLNGNIVIKDSNFVKIGDFLKMNRNRVFTACAARHLINKKYFAVRTRDLDGFLDNINLKRKQTMILVENITTNEKCIFNNSIEVAKFLNMSNGSISRAINKNKILKNNKITRYYGEMH